MRSPVQRRVKRTPCLRISLEGTGRRWLSSVLLLLAVTMFSFEVGKLWLASAFAHTSDAGAWRRAAQLEPGNAEYWHRLGQSEEWDFEWGRLQQAVTYYEKATEVNPHSAAYWMDLGSSSETLGEIGRARKAFERARASQPGSPQVAWRYGNFLLRQQEVSQAFAEIRRAVASDPNLTSSAIAECWKAELSVDRLLNEVLPPHGPSYFLALDYFVDQKQPDAALAVWNRVLGLKQPLGLSQVAPLVDELVLQDRFEDALQVWRQALVAAGREKDKDAHGSSSLVFNGGFEHPPVNGGFDWRQSVIAGASLAFDTAVFHSGSRSLRITFDGSRNPDFSHFLQWVPVRPLHHYRFAAYLRTEEISTDSGVRFLLSDLGRPAALQVLTPDLVGTHSWTRIEQALVTTAETDVLVIMLRRTPTWKFDDRLGGSVWVDDVSLDPVVDPQKDSPQ